MTAILANIAGKLIKMVILGAVAVAGVICGKKYLDKKEAGKAGQTADEAKP